MNHILEGREKMKNKLVATLMLLTLILSTLMIAVRIMPIGASPAATVWWVGAGAVGNGTAEANPAGNITYVLSVCSPNDVINVKPGIYNTTVGETFPITIGIANLTIQSTDGAAGTIIDGGGGWSPGVHMLNNVTLQGFTIRNFKANATYGIGGVLVEGDGSTIGDNIVENIFNCTTAPAGIGIDVHAKDVQITNNIVHDVGSIGIRVRDNWVASTGVSNNVLIENNTVYRTNNTGVLVTGYAKTVTIRNNEIYESLEPTPYSLFVHYNSSDVIIENNHIHDSLYSNIVLAGCDNITISGNTVTGAPTWSSPGKNIYILNDYGSWTGDPTLLSTNINITNNNIKNGGYGVRLLYTEATGDPTAMASTTIINYNNITGNNQYGVENAIGGTEVDATLNWWDNATGPYHPTTNPSGTGDNVTDNVDYVPWLIKPYPPAVLVPELHVDSATIESPSYAKNFTTDVKLANVTDLYGPEFKLYWNTTLLDLVYANITLPAVWGTDYYIARNETNETLGRYWFSVTATDPAPSFNGTTTLVTLTFKITYVPIYPENVSCLFDLNETILGDPDAKPIPHVVYDGEYWCYAARAKIQVLPQVSEAKALHQVFNLSINVANVANLYTFEFTLQYNTTHLDAKEMTITSFPDRTYKVSKKILDDTQGLVTLRVESISPSLQVNESLELASITFEVTNATTWQNPSIESDFSFGSTELITDTGAVDHDKIDGLYRYTPIPGDINGDGIVNIMDLATVARAYGTKPGDPKWNELVDVNNDNIINILDLIPVARNYGRTD